MNRIELPREHLEAVNRRRRIINHYDACIPYYEPSRVACDVFVETKFGFADWPGSQVDSVWWDIGESNLCVYQSDILEPLPGLKEWIEAGNDLLRPFVQESRRRELEVFVSHRMNGCEEAHYPPEVGMLPIKEAHRDWLLNWNPDPNGLPEHGTSWDKRIGLWNYAVPELRQFKLDVLRELAENYDLDGIQLDFARTCPVLPIGHQWENRESLTEFMRSVRSMLLDVAQKRGRPFLLAAKAPETLAGCHFDGLDVEAWARERLLDMFVLGCRSLEADIPSFRRITEGTHIKLYPSHDCHHASDAYKYPSVEVVRGLGSNWWRQGADGIQVFNHLATSAEEWRKGGLVHWTEEGSSCQDWQRNAQVLREIGSPETLLRKNKTFVVQRRAGGSPWMFGWPEEGRVQHYTYHNSNMLAALPARLGRNGHAHTLLPLYVGDDVNADADRIASIELRVLLSDPSAKDLPPDQCIKAGTARPAVYKVEDQDSQETIPISKQMLAQVEVRLNNIPLGPVTVEGGWLTFPVQPNQLAAGENLVGIRITGEHDSARDDILIERLELGVIYSKGSENP